MDLREHLGREMDRNDGEHRNALRRISAARRSLRNFDHNTSHYHVRLHSPCAVHGADIVYAGSLPGAIASVESSFRMNNNGEDVGSSADYKVTVLLGELEWVVPKKFWKQYTLRERQRVSEAAGVKGSARNPSALANG